jgi:hypothetical protein
MDESHFAILTNLVGLVYHSYKVARAAMLTRDMYTIAFFFFESSREGYRKAISSVYWFFAATCQ